MAIKSSDNATLQAIKRLDTGKLLVQIVNDDGSLRDISGDNLVFETRYTVNDVNPLFTKTSSTADEIEILDQQQADNKGKAYIYIMPNDTRPLARDTKLRCQLEVTDSNGNTDTTMFILPVIFRQ